MSAICRTENDLGGARNALLIGNRMDLDLIALRRIRFPGRLKLKMQRGIACPEWPHDKALDAGATEIFLVGDDFMADDLNGI